MAWWAEQVPGEAEELQELRVQKDQVESQEIQAKMVPQESQVLKENRYFVRDFSIFFLYFYTSMVVLWNRVLVPQTFKFVIPWLTQTNQLRSSVGVCVKD